MTASPLAITLLGEFSLTQDGRSVAAFAGDRPISLLAYLLLNRHTAVSRQHLAFTLWPDSGDSQARANLRNLFYTLRQTLPQADTYLAADSMTLQWRADARFTLDVAEFEAALALAGTAAAPQDKATHLETAVALYKGDLLPNCYDDWIVPLREELRQSNLDALHQLVMLHTQQQNYRAATRYSQRLLLQDPLDESAYVQLMRLHALSGDRAGVRRVFENCIAMLRRELDVEPSATTRDAYEQFLRLETPGAPPVTTAVVMAPPSPTLRPLPVPATPFIGREAELAQLSDLLAEPDCRLITVVGPGGIGKTRLALQTAVAHQPVFAHGVAFIDLAPIQDPDLVVTTIARSLSLPITDLSSRVQQLLDHLQNAALLLILDNVEHLPITAGIVTELLAGAPALKILVTSRRQLELPGEWVFDLQGLPLPDAGSAAAGNSAVALFLQTAQRVNRSFALTPDDETAVIHICRLVDGSPLGLQLAATWARLLSCAEIAAEIERDLDFLSSSQQQLPERQRSIRAVFDYSWQLLTPTEQHVAARLALFRGGFSRDAAQAVSDATLPILLSLVDRALLQRVDHGRYELHALVRQYLLRHLQATAVDLHETQRAHAAYFQRFAASGHAQLQGPDGMHWLAQMDSAVDNFRAALAWTLEQGEIALGLQLAGSLWRYWWWRGDWREGLDWLERLLAAVDAGATTAVETHILATANQAAGVLARNLGNYARARACYEQSLALHRVAGNPSGQAAAINSLGTMAMFEGSYEEAEALFAQSLALYEASGNQRGRETAVNNQGIVAMYRGDFERARALHEDNLILSRERGNAAHIAAALGNYGDVLRYLHDYDTARAALSESLHLLRDIDNRQALAITLYALGRLALDTGEWEEACDCFLECLALYQRNLDPVAVADLMEGVAMLLGKQARPLPCAQLYGAAAAIRRMTGTVMPGCDRDAHAAVQAEAVTAVGETAFQAAWRRGHRMTLQEALATGRGLLENDEG